MVAGHRVVVSATTVNAGLSAHLDFGANDALHGHTMFIEACHADGTPAPVRMRHSQTDSAANPAQGTDSLICVDGHPYVFILRKDLNGHTFRYLNVLGLSDGTLITAARYTQVGA